MAVTLVCHYCGQKLTLFSVDEKKRKGYVRCTRCGARIAYNLDQRRIQRTGFWARTVVPFDKGTRKRVELSVQRNSHHEAVAKRATPPANSTFQPAPGFAAFDLKTGKIIKK